MNLLFVDETSLPYFQAQANLNGTFHHNCYSADLKMKVPYLLTVERTATTTTFTVEMLGQRHSMTLRELPRHIDLRIAAFVENIANGRIDTCEQARPLAATPGAEIKRQISCDQAQQIRSLITEGGFGSLDLGLQQPVLVALHRTRSRQGVTAILGADGHRHTKCFTAYGVDSYVFDLVMESLAHLISTAASAERAV